MKWRKGNNYKEERGRKQRKSNNVCLLIPLSIRYMIIFLSSIHPYLRLVSSVSLWINICRKTTHSQWHLFLSLILFYLSATFCFFCVIFPHPPQDTLFLFTSLLFLSLSLSLFYEIKRHNLGNSQKQWQPHCMMGSDIYWEAVLQRDMWQFLRPPLPPLMSLSLHAVFL